MSVGEERIVYLCDAKKNKECKVPICYGKPNLHPDWGKCKYTTDQRYSKDGKRYFYDSESGKYKEVK